MNNTDPEASRDAPGPDGSPVVRATLWMLGTLASFTLMALSGRELSLAGFNTFQILFWRSLAGLVLVVVLLSHFGWRNARTRQPGRQLFRNLVHFGGQYGWFFAIGSITLQEVFALEFTMPIWALILAALFLGERVTASRVLAVVFGFAGVLIVLRPGVSEVSIGHAAVLGAAFCYASSHVLTKQLVRTDTPLAVLFYMTAVQLPIALLFGLDGWVWPAWPIVPWVVLVGFSALGAHYCISRALSLVDATIVAPMDFMRLPLVAVVGALLYAEQVGIWVFVGGLVILAGNLLNARAERHAARVGSTASPPS